MALCLAKTKHKLSKSSISLLPHQVDALKWMIKREMLTKSNGEVRKGPYGGILADDMGLGKTLETIGLLLAKGHSKTIIIVPANLISQWKDEFKKFAPHIPIVEDVDSNIDGTVLIMSYIKAIRSQYVRDNFWNRIILDEAHYIRNPKGTVHKDILKLKAKSRWCLTGTPIQNYLSDICSLLAFIGIRKNKNEKLDKYLNKYMLRRTKEGIHFEMPPITYSVEKVEHTSTEEKQFYEKVKANTYICSDVHHLEVLLRLRQAALLPQMVADGYIKKTKDKKLVIWRHSNSKLDALVKTLVDNPKEKPIVFCYFTKEIEYLKKSMSHKKIKYRIINGSVSMDERQKIISESDEFRVLVVQMMAGSTGLNLQKFNAVYFSGPHWNPTHEQQAVARAYRIGQQNSVIVRKFVLKHTIEELILTIQERKQKMIDECM